MEKFVKFSILILPMLTKASSFDKQITPNRLKMKKVVG